MTAESCPHCFAPARANGRPGCTCAERAAASTAAAGETDDQTHPQPYVTRSEEHPSGPDPRDLRLFEEAERKKAEKEEAEKGDTEETRVIDRVEERPRGGGADGDLFADGGAPGEEPGPARHRKSKRKVVAAVLAGAAAVAVAGSLAVGTGLLGGDHKEDGGGASDRTLADSTASAPVEEELPAAEGSPSSGAPSSSATPRPSAPGSASASASASPSETGPSATARPSASGSATGSATKPGPTASGGPTSAPSDPPGPTGPPALREGDSGPEVAELQKRLSQLLLYIGAADGEYDAGVRRVVSSYQDQHDITGDPDGVYGENTRRDLESRTREP
ncbi:MULTISPECIES: peptidoglycan-binding protein [Streptomyces]|uniref:Peptidoglycan binding-like domain-containing protein n=1 Tax=Streptomyces mordarskii TaxID=1226758 RepID=A0ABP3LT63_9ACTN|nr:MULTISPECIES: peptidoglycan-binding domain-containing protein [unclassified Streptomyces]QTI88493.1 peptidoglycan-binding protein [Streptomyces sp. AgN23]RSS37464.1 peptidoglycan-binding protein [Streptomyces sp. WAC05858]WTA81339.1 peptidoglycan-binding protein [Streptomyces antimycoticus]WTB08196.1 peptidoglycan-binding protein [Streptomyces antimycoticus]